MKQSASFSRNARPMTLASIAIACLAAMILLAIRPASASAYETPLTVSGTSLGGQSSEQVDGIVDDAFAVSDPEGIGGLTVRKSGAKSLKLTWSSSPVQKFEIFRSANESYGYKRIATTQSATFTDKKVKKGITYYYFVRATFADGGASDTPTCGQIIPKKSKAAYKAIPQSVSRTKSGSFDMTFSDISYYTQGSKLYAVCHMNGKIKVIGFNSKMKKVSLKTVKLPKLGRFSGFFHGPDGSNYVLLRFTNSEEKTGAVIGKLIKYSGTWKKGKTAILRSGDNDETEGIYSAFVSGDVSFAMQGTVLYLFGERYGFSDGSGMNHMSNIGFSIDTATMKAKQDRISFTSHSFSRNARFKDGSLYLADMGDANPHGVNLTWQDAYGTANASEKKSILAFALTGNTGLKMGASLCGMEVGSNNIITCGVAQPHGYTVAGVTGRSDDYKQNVFVTVTNRTTGASKVKWLTSINPKKDKRTVWPPHMIKLADNRFALLYTIVKSGKQMLYYTAIDDTGKKLLTKKYSNVVLSGNHKPILMNGCIYWTDEPESGKHVLYRIPAL